MEIKMLPPRYRTRISWIFSMSRKIGRSVLSFLFLTMLLPISAARATRTIPPTWAIVAENFEGGTLGAWNTVRSSRLSLLPGGGRNGSTGLAVTVSQDEAYIYQSRVAYAVEGYLTFWLNPNGVALPEPSPNYWPPGTSLCVGQVRSSANDWWPPLIGFYLRKPPGQGYKGFIAWPKANGYFYDWQSGAFDLVDGWQKITLGYRIDSWVAVWVNDVLVRSYDSGVVHEDPSGDVIEIGKVNENANSTPGGSIRLDDVAFQVPRVADLWVDAVHGSDANDGLTPATAFKSIQRAADLAGPGSIVHILPGIYRETVYPALSGSVTEPAVYRAENGPGTVVIRGAEPSSSLTWHRLSDNPIGLPGGVYSNVYWADLSVWNLNNPPRFIVQLGDNGQEMTRLPLAREPDWQVVIEWKTHEFWWSADGGSAPAACDPVTNTDHDCDLPQRSMTQLTDRTDDTEPVGVEPGNLTTLGSLISGTLVALDTVQGHYVYRRIIVAHDVANGRITVDRVCEHDSGTGNPGLGWGSKYYVENRPRLLDTPGEWWYDPSTKRLYLWPPTPADPATLNLEISRRTNGFSLQNRSYLILDGLTIEFLNGSAIYLANWKEHKAYGDVVRHATLRYANWGVYLEQGVQATAPPGNSIDGFTLENSEIAYMDTYAIRLIDWWENNAAADAFTRSGIVNTIIRNNEMHHLGFRTDGDNAIGASFMFANRLRFEGNHVHHVAHNGVQFSESVIQSSKSYGFSPAEIKTGDILIANNVFEKACQLTTDCGGLKFWGDPPDNHVFRNVLITGNIFRHTFGWTSVAEKRGRWMGGTNSVVRGMGGFGLYVDNASGVHVYRNVAYNNAYTGYMFAGVWRDGEMLYAHNVAANSLHGFTLGGRRYDTHGCVNTQLLSNIIINNEGYGIRHDDNDGLFANITIDHNLYFNNGWRAWAEGGVWQPGAMTIYLSGVPNRYYPTLADIRANTAWEDHGVAGDPAFRAYDVADHNMFDGSWPDFHLTAASSNAIDQGMTTLPASLTALLSRFGVEDLHWGAAYDIGRYEGGFTLLAQPATQAIAVGETARYTISLYPRDLPHPVTLSTASPSSSLLLTLTPTLLTAGDSAVLTAGCLPHGTLEPGRRYTLPITGTGGGFTQRIGVELLSGGMWTYLPIVLRGN